MTEDDIDVLDTEEPDSDAVAAYYAEFDKGSDREVRRMVEFWKTLRLKGT